MDIYAELITLTKPLLWAITLAVTIKLVENLTYYLYSGTCPLKEQFLFNVSELLERRAARHDRIALSRATLTPID